MPHSVRGTHDGAESSADANTARVQEHLATHVVASSIVTQHLASTAPLPHRGEQRQSQWIFVVFLEVVENLAKEGLLRYREGEEGQAGTKLQRITA